MTTALSTTDTALKVLNYGRVHADHQWKIEEWEQVLLPPVMTGR